MAIIQIEELNVENYELSYLSELTDSEAELTRGGLFWLVLVEAAYLGYQIGKEIKERTK